MEVHLRKFNPSLPCPWHAMACDGEHVVWFPVYIPNRDKEQQYEIWTSLANITDKGLGAKWNDPWVLNYETPLRAR